MSESQFVRELFSSSTARCGSRVEPDKSANHSPLASAPPRVTLLREESARHPFALAIAAAWSCYGAKPARVENVVKLVYDDPDPSLSPEKAADRAKRRDRALRLYADLFAAGHHTTFQHANFVFVLDNVSRLAIWSFFHSHPHYNSEQVSQRYREVTGAAMAIPHLPPGWAGDLRAGNRAQYRRIPAIDIDPQRGFQPRLCPGVPGPGQGEIP